MSKAKVSSGMWTPAEGGWIWHFGTSALRLGQLRLICNAQDETFWILKIGEVTKEWLGQRGLHDLLYHGLGKCRWAGEAQDET